MHFKASLFEIKKGYRKIKQLAKESLQNKDYEQFNKYFKHCVTIASQFNWIYRDDELEDLQYAYANTVITNRQNQTYKADPNNWVFYDDYCTSYVLALQWLSALSKTGNNILYITAQNPSAQRVDLNIISDIKKLSNVTVEVIPDESPTNRANYLYNLITTFNASKLFLHKALNSLVDIPLCVLPDSIIKYNINLADQFFWMGCKWIDYNIEFRPFGASVSVQQRGLRKDQLLMVPFYPIDENRSFQGFPELCSNRLVIFSGGDFYKTVDKKNTYWLLVKELLTRYPNVVFLFATKRSAQCNESINRFIKENHFEDRFCYIHYRQDIYQVFAHCDIYMGTSPISGSLMSQLAAINSKPILQYYPPGTQDDETEQAICINEQFPISFSSKKEFMAEAERLICDREYREQQGKRLNNAMMHESQFNQLVDKTVQTDKNQMPLGIYEINYSRLTKRWLELRDTRVSDIGNYIYSILGSRECLRSLPTLFIKKNFFRFLGPKS